MSKCSAGGCDIECGGGRGCGCIAESDNPDTCTCICTGGETAAGFTFEAVTLVDVSVDDLPLFELAGLLNAVSARRVMIPGNARNAPVSLKIARCPFETVVASLGLAMEAQQRPPVPKADTRSLAITMLTLAVGVLVGLHLSRGRD